MVKIDLDTLSLAELKDLQSGLDKAIEHAEKRERKEALEKLEAQAQEMGFSLAELLAMKNGKSGAGRKSSKPRTPSAPKYCHPEDPTVTWTGRGRQPNWIKEGVAGGKSLDDFLIR